MRRRSLVALLIYISLYTVHIFAAPADPSTQSLVVSSTEPSDGNESGKMGDSMEVTSTVPKMYQMHVNSIISNRFAHTTITSKVKNLANKAQGATFSVILPETAFISGFIMEIDGKNYTAYVKGKEEAKKDYDEAVASGFGAAHVAVSARDSSRFTVSVNIEPQSKAAFYLTYEQLLKRQNGRYEQVINLHPGQPVQDLSVEVVITESRNITYLNTPPIRSGNEIGNDNAELDPRAKWEKVDYRTAIIRFNPNLEKQKQFAHILETKEDEGFAGQFVVQYDVERDPKGGEVLIQDGYFVHFFAPSELPALPKHVVFVLDTSASMEGQKMSQLKEAMHKILGELHDQDLFNLVEFNTNVRVWNLDDPASSVWYPFGGSVSDPCFFQLRDQKEEVSFKNYKFPGAYSASADNIKKARDGVSNLIASGGTDISTALRVGLHLVELAKGKNTDAVKRQPILVFLTDGEPTIRVTSTEEITTKITNLNTGLKESPIFALSFGDGADKNFLQKLALRNSGFSKHIYEAADASLQLQDFYEQISSPLLANVSFKYEPSVTSLTKTEFPIHFHGSELVVAGWCGTDDIKPPTVNGWGVHGPESLEPAVQHSVSNIERLWAYLTVQQLLERKEVSDKDQEELKNKALDLALKYSFVTPVSSLIVVKPNDTSAVDTEIATEKGSFSDDYYAGDFVANSPVLLGATAPPVIYTTPFCRELLFTTTTETPTLLTTLPWLNDILNDKGILNLQSGHYKLGLNETLSDVVACPKTPLNAEGNCKLLHSCPQVHSLLTSSDIFAQHFCVLKEEFAGVCCPHNS